MPRTTRRILGEYLVLAAQAGDRAALSRLAGLWQAPLRRHAARLTGDAEAAHDVVQEAWLDILRGLGGLRRSEAFAAWAHRIVTRKCAAWIKARQRDRRLAADLDAEPRPETPPDAAANAERRDEARRVRAVIAALPPPQASAVALFYQEEMSVTEIAIALDIPPGTVKTRLMHARRKIRETLEMDKEGGAS